MIIITTHEITAQLPAFRCIAHGTREDSVRTSRVVSKETHQKVDVFQWIWPMDIWWKMVASNVDSMNKTWLMAILCHKWCGMLSQNMDMSWSMVMFIGISWIFIMSDIFITGNHQSGFPQPIPWRIYNDYWCSPKKPSNCHSNSIIIYIYVYII